LSTLATAKVTDGYGPVELTQVELGDPEAGEVLVELKASGVCHTDFDVITTALICVFDTKQLLAHRDNAQRSESKEKSLLPGSHLLGVEAAE
jgi:NADPH:quinone reductase-like Zn-dependent oxidoreductase